MSHHYKMKYALIDLVPGITLSFEAGGPFGPVTDSFRWLRSNSGDTKQKITQRLTD